MAAALAFYATFSAAPALLIGMAVAGAFVGRSVARSMLMDKIQEFVSPDAAAYIFMIVGSFWDEVTARSLPIVGIGAGLVAATAVFAELQSSLNTIWDAHSKERSGLLTMIRERAIAFVFVVAIGILLLASVVAAAVLGAINAFFADIYPIPHWLLHGLKLLTNFGMIPGLLALTYKLIPDAPVAWRDVWLGSIIASILFVGGTYLFGLYLRLSVLLSVYGAAGSLVILLMWVYYSAQVFFLGAELTKVWARRYGSMARRGDDFGGEDSGHVGC
jgi:membrane protein